MTESYWLEPITQNHPRLHGEHGCDVVVIGGGLCGTSAAYHLAQAGVRVILLEARTLSESASGRNAGFLLQGTAERYSRAIEVMGHDRAKRIHSWSLENHRMMAEVLDRERIECAYQKRGSLQLAGTPEEEAELLESARLLNADGFLAERLDRHQLAPALQNAGFQMGVLLPEDGELQPARFVRGVGDSAATQGAGVFERS
ncbi:MAG: FAD-dependent oxidoreductase, partial [Myxococcota bacterium]|nr:FAD-dependent oxidoreductase [Myxococcota bacterium]